MLKIQPAKSELQFQQARELMTQLSAWDAAQVNHLGLDGEAALKFYYASRELELPGAFAPPKGRLFLATYSDQAAGCGAFHRMDSQICEIKRMYVRPEFRNMRIGRELIEQLIRAARDAGYQIMRLETTTFMDTAIAMYSSFGFQTCLPYYVIPESFEPITVFMQLNLANAR